MKKRILPLLTGMLLSMIGFAQSPVDTVFLERFDPPSGPDSVTTYNTSSLVNSEWNDTNHLFVSPTMSMHTRIVPNDSVILETDNFSTVGNVFVRLKFNHICKIQLSQRGYLQASNDGGQTWQNVMGTHYQGNSPQFGQVNYFNELSYPDQNASPYWGGVSTPATPPVAPTSQWWAEETFDLSPILGGTNGYANCKIRFIASHLINIPVSASGWYVDNILVEAAPCELEPPKFTYNVTPQRKPVGARYNASQEVRVKAKDVQSGIDSVILHYKWNNGPWQDTLMTSGSSNCPDSAVYVHNFTNIALYDTIRWYVEIFDCACPNITRDPIASALPNYYKFWRADAPPPICGTAYPNSFPLVVSQFPYLEDFENTLYWQAGSGAGATGTAHRGTWPTNNTPLGLNWTVSPNPNSTGFAWSIRSNGGTATLNTGPSGDNSSNGQGQYLFTEASQGNGAGSPQFTAVTTPCIDLSLLGCAALEFYYHMYGSDMDRLRVDVDTGHATSSWVYGVAVFVGQEQNASNAPYRKAFVSLEQFQGKIVRIRFIGRKNTSTAQDKNDIAIDDIRIFEPKPVDVEMTDYFEPLNGYCSYSANELVKGKFQSLGCQTLSEVPVAFKVEFTPSSAPAPAPVILRDTIDGNFPLSSDSSFTFTPTADLSGYGTYRLWIWSEAPGDTTNTNDTVGPYTIEHLEPFSNYPYILDFDGPQTQAGNGTTGNPGVTGTNEWNIAPGQNSGEYSIFVGSEKTPSAATGPRWDYSGKFDGGNYIYGEANYGSKPTNSAVFHSECFDLTGLTNPVFDFMYHFYGADAVGIVLQVVPANSNNWTTIPGGVIAQASQKQTSSRDQWKYFSVDLSSYAGQTIKLRFVIQKSGGGTAGDIAIDNIRVYDKNATDVGVVDVSGLGTRVDLNLANLPSPQFLLRNFGTSSVSNVQISYSVTPLCGPNAGTPTNYTATYSGTIAPGADHLFTVPASSAPSTYPVGDFELCASTNQTGDTYTFNDSYCARSVGWPVVPIQTGFAEDFDACNEGVESGFWAAGTYQTFEIDQANSSSAPNGYGSYSWPYTSYPNTDENLFAPRFIGFDTIVGAELYFTHKFNFGANDAGVVEYFSGGNWLPLGFNDPNDQIGINWYNGANVSQASNSDAFVNNSTSYASATNGWVTSMWPLNVYNFSQAPLILRWHQINAGGGATGWTVDNIEVRIPPQNSASPYTCDTEQYLLIPGQPADVKVRIQNTGAKVLDSCLVKYQTRPQGGTWGPWSNDELVVMNNGNGILSNNLSQWYTFNQQWTNTTSGTHDVRFVTSRPNNKQENYTQDDTLICQFKVLDEVPINNTDTSYCNNFDDPAQVDWIELNTFKKTGLVSWEKGAPSQAPIVSAHSAPNAWMTKLTNNYKMRDSSALHTPVFVTDSGLVYEMEFWHNFSTEKFHDGGTIDVTFDGGVNWRTVGFVLPDSSWYTTTHVTSLDILNPGWTGESNGWIKSNINVEFDQDRKMIFRFRFASDQSFEYQGWAIDDFCFRTTSGSPDDYIGVDENPVDVANIGNIIPNPSSGMTQIPFYLPSQADVKLDIYNTLGQQMLSKTEHAQSGVSNISFDVTGWTPGLYIVSLEINGETVTKKMMVK